jgi:hypothetical protein
MADIPTVMSRVGSHLEEKKGKFVFDVFNFIKTINPNKSVSWLATEATTATGVRRGTVLTSEVKLYGFLSERPRRKGKAEVRKVMQEGDIQRFLSMCHKMKDI